MAENQEGQEKTEPATPKRLREARMRGQVAKSVELTTAAITLIGGALTFILGKPLIESFKRFASFLFRESGSVELTFQNVERYYKITLGLIAESLLPLLIAVYIVALAAETAQVGFKIADKKFTEGLNFKTVFNPFIGLKKIFFSGRSIFELAKSVLKLLFLGAIAYQVLYSRRVEILTLTEKSLSDFGAAMVSISLELVLKLGTAYIAIAAADWAYQKYKFKEDMKMTKQEVKEETRQTEGDPKIRARIRQLMRGRIRKLMLSAAEKADVVITNPTHYAVALRYDSKSMEAPKVVAKGVDFLAKQIREIAEANRIPIVEDPPLARALFFNAEIDREIPEKFFKSVARILAYVYSLKKRA